MAVYPEPTNLTGLMGLMEYTNTVTDNLWGRLMLIALYLTVFIFLVLKREPADESLAAAGMITVLFAVL